MSHYIFSRLDCEAMQALANFRRLVGVDDGAMLTPAIVEAAIASTSKRQAFLEIGDFVDGLRRWDLFATVTFRPLVRREANPRGLARLELAVKNYERLPLFRGAEQNYPQLSCRDFEYRLASRTASENYVRGFFDRFRRKLQRDLGTPVSYFVGFEAGPSSGQNHFHALLGARGLRDIRRRDLWEWLHANAGRSLILPFERERGAGWYLAVGYVGKRPLGWDCHVHGRLRLRRKPTGNAGGRDVVPSADMERPFFHATCPRRHR
jgi:hypothetical protein